MNKRLSIGPVQYYWPSEQLQEFYAMVADSPVDIVYLGETVCSKRRSLNFDGWLALADMLTEAGKEVVLSTLALVEADSELKLMRRICDNGRFRVEANDMAAVQMLSQHADFIAGPTLNIYNTRTLRKLHKLGLRRWVMPVEQSHDTLRQFRRDMDTNIEVEVFAWGRMPLAYSARCYTARNHNLPKDDCDFRCIKDPDGMLLKTREDEDFLVLNGIQTQSARSMCLVHELTSPEVDIFRISPQSRHTEHVINVYHDVRQGRMTGNDAVTVLESLMPTGPCNGYWHGKAGMAADCTA